MLRAIPNPADNKPLAAKPTQKLKPDSTTQALEEELLNLSPRKGSKPQSSAQAESLAKDMELKMDRLLSKMGGEASIDELLNASPSPKN